MLVLGISPAEAFGCLCAERIAGQRGVAVQCLPYVVRCHPQAGRPRDLLLHGREQAPPNVLISHEERPGAFDRRQRGRPGAGERPTRRSRQRRLRLPRQAVPVVHRPHLLTVPPEVLRLEVGVRSEEHTSELQSPCNLVCRLLLEKKKKKKKKQTQENKTTNKTTYK